LALAGILPVLKFFLFHNVGDKSEIREALFWFSSK